MSRFSLADQRHCLPIVSAGGTRTGLIHRSVLDVGNVLPVMRCAGPGIDGIENILKYRFFVTKKLSGLAIEFPENTGLADGECELFAVVIHENALEDSSRSNDSPGACWKCHASFPVSGLRARVELAINSRHRRTDGLPASTASPGQLPSR